MSDFKTFKKYLEAMQSRDWMTCDLIAEENRAILKQLKETQEKLEKHELLYSKHKKLKEQLDEANEVIGFYGDRYSWETWKCEDFKAYGGKKAREYLTKYKVQ